VFAAALAAIEAEELPAFDEEEAFGAEPDVAGEARA